MSNSKLVNYTKKSPNHSGKRAYPISRITIHHMAGVLTVEQCGEIFAKPARQASSNYGIDSKGRVGLYVDEKNRSWASSNRDNDNRAITIEVSNSKTGGDWPVSDKAYKKLVELCVDICKRNGKTKVIWTTKGKALAYQPKDNEIVLTLHKWFAPTACCGPYLSGKMGVLAKEINALIESTATPEKTAKNAKYKVLQAGGMNVRQKASDTSKIIGTVKEGATIITTEKKKTGSQTWVYVPSKKGWVCQKGKKTYLKKV